MAIDAVSQAFQTNTSYSESDLNGQLNNRLGFYSSLQDKVELSNAATQMGKSVLLADDKEKVPTVSCSLGNLNVAQSAKRLHESDYKKYTKAMEDIGSGNQKKLLQGLNSITGETQSSLKKRISELNLKHAGRFVNQLAALSEGEVSSICTAISKLTEHNAGSIASTVKSEKLYV